MPRRYDMRPSPHRRDDPLFRDSYVVPTSWPSFVDLRRLASPVRDQGELGGCTGFAIATGLREFLEIRFWQRRYQLSPLWLYYQERLLEGDVGEDAGATPADGMKVLSTIGCAPEAADPYLPEDFADPPAPVANAEAAAYRVLEYHRLLGLEDVRSALVRGFGVVLGFMVYQSFESESVAKTGKVPMPVAGEELLGGHAAFIVGYHQDPGWAGGGYLIVKNSWGIGWGDRGYFYLPYAYIENPSLTTDLWTATRTLPEPPPDEGEVPVLFGGRPLGTAGYRRGPALYLPLAEVAERSGFNVRLDGRGLHVNGPAPAPAAEEVPLAAADAEVPVFLNGEPRGVLGWRRGETVLLPARTWALWTGWRVRYSPKAAAILVDRP